MAKMTADEAKAKAKKAYDTGAEECPLCKGERKGLGFKHGADCLAKGAKKAAGSRRTELEKDLTDAQKKLATKLATDAGNNASVLKYAAMLCKKPPARVATATLWETMEAAGADEELIAKVKASITAG